MTFEERRKKNRPVWIDRRVDGKDHVQQGFHKKAHLSKSLLFGLILSLIIILNLFDLLFTSIALARGAKELNPFVAYLLNQNLTGLAILLKLGGVSAAAVVLWYFKHFRLTLRLTLFTVFVYALLLAYHLTNLPLILAAS